MTHPANGALYTPGTDYTLDAVNGIVTQLASGAIAPDALVDIVYAYAEVVTAIANSGSRASRYLIEIQAQTKFCEHVNAVTAKLNATMLQSQGQ